MYKIVVADDEKALRLLISGTLKLAVMISSLYTKRTRMIITRFIATVTR